MLTRSKTAISDCNPIRDPSTNVRKLPLIKGGSRRQHPAFSFPSLFFLLPSSFFFIIKIVYAQEHRQNSRQTSSRYFYVRTHSLKEFPFQGEWYLEEGVTFSVYRAEYHHYPISIEFWICSVSEDFEQNRISIYPSENVASVSGKFRIIAESNSKTYAPRLME